MHQKKFRETGNSFIAEGPKVVEELLQSGCTVSKIFAVKDYAVQHLSAKISSGKTMIVSDAELKKLSALTTPNKVLAVADIPNRKISYDSINKSLSLALDGVSDPGNLGAIIRIAHWFGIKNIVCSENSVDAYNPKVVQAAMGSLFYVNIIQTGLQGFFSDKKISVPVYGAVLKGKNIYESKLKKPAVVLFGSEGAGISDELKQFITHPVTIPASSQSHKPDSLNVASSAAILCAEFFR